MSASHYRVFDLLKTIASNLIVLHHIAFYGPMADVARPVMPELIAWLEEHARIAVHAFLAMGGFLAARSLSMRQASTGPMQALLRRFIKLVPPFMAAMGLAVLASMLASEWMTHDSISAMPTIGQLLAHAFLLHSVLGYESLSAGAWYVAIDFQLFALMALILWVAERRPMPAWAAPFAISLGAAASLMVFNLDPDWDVWAPYFFGSYALGALAWWASERARTPASTTILAGVMLLLGALALGLEFRSRVAVALGTAILLMLACRGIVRLPGQDLRAVAYLGRISYAVFLVHFPVSLVVNAAFTRFAPMTPEAQAIGMMLAWLLSIAAGAAFHRWIERPLADLTENASAHRGARRPFMTAPAE